VVIQHPETLVEQSNADFSKFLGLLADTVSAPSFTWTRFNYWYLSNNQSDCNINCRDDRELEFVNIVTGAVSATDLNIDKYRIPIPRLICL
jgi:hypothetical protein